MGALARDADGMGVVFMGGFFSVSFWTLRTALGLCIAGLAAVLALGGLNQFEPAYMSWAEETLPTWAHRQLAPAFLLVFVSALLIRIGLRSLALGGLLAAVFVLFNGVGTPPSIFLALLDSLAPVLDSMPSI